MLGRHGRVPQNAGVCPLQTLPIFGLSAISKKVAGAAFLLLGREAYDASQGDACLRGFSWRHAGSCVSSRLGNAISPSASVSWTLNRYAGLAAHRSMTLSGPG